MTESTDDELQSRFLQELLDLSSAGMCVHFELDVSQAWAILAQLQLALRHPANGGYAASVAQQVIRMIAAEICPPGSAAESVYLRGARGL